MAQDFWRASFTCCEVVGDFLTRAEAEKYAEQHACDRQAELLKEGTVVKSVMRITRVP